jgi:hypothetical protein
LSVSPETEVALSEWAESTRMVADKPLTAVRRAVLDSVIFEIMAEIQRRIGTSFSLAEIVGLYRDSGPWCLEVAMRTTDQPWAYDLSLVQGAAFGRYARNAYDFRL